MILEILDLGKTELSKTKSKKTVNTNTYIGNLIDYLEKKLAWSATNKFSDLKFSIIDHPSGRVKAFQHVRQV